MEYVMASILDRVSRKRAEMEEEQALFYLNAGYTIDQLTRWEKVPMQFGVMEFGVCPKSFLENGVQPIACQIEMKTPYPWGGQ
jgi:hypothetical protein